MEYTERFFMIALILTVVFAGVGVFSREGILTNSVWTARVGTNLSATALPSAVPSAMAPQEENVYVYFGRQNNAAQGSCTTVYPVMRSVAETNAAGLASLIELLKGPTPDEAQTGYMTSINPNVDIHYLSVTNGTAQADFSGGLENAAGGSCRVAAIRAQITQTLKQFPSIQNVTISVDGRTVDALQP